MCLIDRSGLHARLHDICGVLIVGVLFVGVLFGVCDIASIVVLGISDMRSRGWVSQQEHYMYGPPTHCWLLIRISSPSEP